MPVVLESMVSFSLFQVQLDGLPVGLREHGLELRVVHSDWNIVFGGEEGDTIGCYIMKISATL